MKFVKFTAVALFATFALAGCADEKISFGSDETVTIETKGYLSISNLAIDCRIDEENPDTGVDPSVSTYATRSSVDVNNFDCTILNAEGEVVKSFKFGERPTENIEFEAGDYILKIFSGEIPNAEWEAPVYGAVKPFKIVRKETTTLSEIVCSLQQIKVTITYAADLAERLGEGTTTTVSVGDNSLAFDKTETRAGYFLAPQASNTLDLVINGTYAADKVNFKPMVMTNQVTNVKAGQHSKIHFYIEHAEEGNIKVNVTIRDWVTDEIIPCNVADLVTEEEWKDESGDEGETVVAPDIIWKGYDLSKRYAIVSGLTVDLEIIAEKGIKELLCEIKSEVLTPSELLLNNLCNVLNLCYPKESYDSNNPSVPIDVEQPLRDLGFKVAEEVIDQTVVDLSITKFLSVLTMVSGTSLKNHDFVLTVIDNAGTETVKTLMLQTGN